MTILAATSRGVLLVVKEETQSRSIILTGRQGDLLPVTQNRNDSWIGTCLENTDEETKGVHDLDVLCCSHQCYGAQRT
jgi:hypothetical protein